jgi:membrane-associated HD superfamily phosphohydrolase
MLFVFLLISLAVGLVGALKFFDASHMALYLTLSRMRELNEQANRASVLLLLCLLIFIVSLVVLVKNTAADHRQKVKKITMILTGLLGLSFSIFGIIRWLPSLAAFGAVAGNLEAETMIKSDIQSSAGFNWTSICVLLLLVSLVVLIKGIKQKK